MKLVCGWVLGAELAGGLLCGLGAAQTVPVKTVPVTTVGAPATNGPATTQIVEPPIPLLPTNDQLVVNDAAVPVDTPEVTTILKEAGLRRNEMRVVVGPGAPVGWVKAYQMMDATGAFSAYTYFRRGGRTVRSNNAGVAETTLSGGGTVLLSGVSLVRMQVKNAETAKALLATIETGLPKIGGRRGMPPLLPTLLPKTGLDVNGLRYALGPEEYREMGGVLPADILEWNKSAEAATAEYSGRGGKGTLTLLMYPTPEIAGETGRAIQNAVNQRGPASFGTVKLRRIGPMVGMTSGGFTAEQAEALLDSVHLNQEVTFDKAMPTEFNTEIKKTVTLLESIAIFTGVGVLAAVVLGVFLGGARAGIRVMQGKPAASEPEFLRIDLRGRPEPLKASAAQAEEAERDVMHL